MKCQYNADTIVSQLYSKQQTHSDPVAYAVLLPIKDLDALPYSSEEEGTLREKCDREFSNNLTARQQKMNVKLFHFTFILVI